MERIAVRVEVAWEKLMDWWTVGSSTGELRCKIFASGWTNGFAGKRVDGRKEDLQLHKVAKRQPRRSGSNVR